MNSVKLSSQFDDLQLSVAYSEPKLGPKAIFQIVHGMAEHKERYYPFMEFLSEQGYICLIHDHRGHGESVKSAADLGYMYKGGAQALVEDVKLVQDWAKNKFPGLEVYLFGHSMGSMVVRAFTKKYDSAISRLIVCGCPSDNPAKGAGLALASIIGFFRGDRYRSSFLNHLAFGSYNKAFEEEKNPLSWLSADKQNTLNYYHDPLCGFVFTVNGFQNLFRIMKECYSDKNWHIKNPALKVLFISGGDDPCRISDKDFYKAVNFLKSRGYSDVQSRLFPGLRHEILLEGKQEVWEEVLAFIK
ncbi:MAG: alpha/beta fold hydrolase [Candidatus Cryptobacteroides sp.]